MTLVKLLSAPVLAQAVAGRLTAQLLMIMFRLLMGSFTLTVIRGLKLGPYVHVTCAPSTGASPR